MCSLTISVKRGWAILIDWRTFCVGARDIAYDDTGLTVQFSNGRRQRIDVRAADGVIELQSIVARRAVVERIERVAQLAWEHNRGTSLVGFREDDRQRL